MPRSNTNLLDGLAGLLGDPRAFDADFDAIVLALPHICKTASADWVATNSGEITGNSIRSWQDRMVAADDLEFVPTSSVNIVGCRGYANGL